MKQFKTISQNKVDMEIGYKKQALIDIMKSDEELGLYDEPKQKTLYDAFLNCLINKEFETKEDYIAFKGAEFGAKWQQEKMYSEEEVLEILFELSCNNDTDKEEMEEWFEQFKKK